MIGTYNVGTYYSINVKTPDVWSFGTTNSITYIFNSVNRLVLNGEEISLSSDIVEVELGGIRVSAIIKIPVFKIHYNSTEVLDLMDLTDVPYNTAYFVGKYNSSVTIGTPDTTAMPFTYLYQQSDFMFSLELYTMKCEKHVVDKSSYLFDKLELFGQLTEECDILNPSILLQYDDTTPLFMYNYVFIPLYWRYYFITSIVSVRKGLWRIGLHVDVLYSYNTDIRKQSGFIVRNQRNPYGIVVPDERISFFAKPTYTFTDVTGGTIANTTLDVNDNTAYNIVLSVINSNTRVVYADSNPPYLSHLPIINSNNYQNALAYNYALDSTHFQTAMVEVSQNQTLSSFIFGAWVYPFKFNKSDESIVPLPLVTTNIVIGTTSLTSVGSLMKYDISPYLIVADFDLPSYNSFDDIEPYTYCDLYIPYYSGLYRFNLQRCAGHNIIVYYSTQFSNGDSFVYVYDMTDEQLLLTAPVQLAQPLAISTTNAFEINQQRALSHIGYAGNTMNWLFKAISSGANDNILGVFTSTQKWMGETIQWGFDQSLMKDTANVGISSANGGYFNPQKVFLITTKRQTNIADAQEYEDKNGDPINTWDVLNRTGYEYTGYTEITQIHYAPIDLNYITSPEIDEIETLAKNGIIL